MANPRHRESGGPHATGESDEALLKEDTAGGLGGTNVEMTGGHSGEVRMRVGKYVCPVEYVNTFTPIEFEEASAGVGFAVGVQASRVAHVPWDACILYYTAVVRTGSVSHVFDSRCLDCLVSSPSTCRWIYHAHGRRHFYSSPRFVVFLQTQAIVPSARRRQTNVTGGSRTFVLVR